MKAIQTIYLLRNVQLLISPRIQESTTLWALVGPKSLTTMTMEPKFQLLFFPDPWQLEPSQVCDLSFPDKRNMQFMARGKIWPTTCLCK